MKINRLIAILIFLAGAFDKSWLPKVVTDFNIPTSILISALGGSLAVIVWKYL